VSRTRGNGRSKTSPFQCSTITSEEAPMPIATRPGAAAARLAAHWARVAGPRVNTGAMAVPSRRAGAHTLARASGVNASALSTSDDQTSV
jgi:hypothetical protein